MTSEAHSGVAPIFVNESGRHYTLPTSSSSIVLCCTGENCIVIVSGANMTLRPADVQNARELIMRSKVMVCQLEVPQETSLEALQLAKKHEGMGVRGRNGFQIREMVDVSLQLLPSSTLLLEHHSLQFSSSTLISWSSMKQR